MLEKMKNKLPGIKGEEKKSIKMPSIEVEIGEEEGSEEEGAPEGDMAEEEVSVGELAQFSDEELKAELEKRGMQVSSVTPMPSTPEEEEEGPAPKSTKRV